MAKLNSEKLGKLINRLTLEEKQRVRNLMSRQVFNHFEDGKNDSLSFKEWAMMNLSAIFTIASTRDDFNSDMMVEILETNEQDEQN